LLRADDGAPEGLWLRADNQVAGKGRLGRTWISPIGNLYASTIVRLKQNDPGAATLAFVAAVATYNAISKLSPFPFVQLKWPNDILSVAGEKLCGILLERSGDAVVVGIGINLAYCPENTERRVTSIAALGLIVPAPQEFLEILAEEFSATLDNWRIFGAAAVLRDWQIRAHPEGTRLTAELPNGEKFIGTFQGLDGYGAMMLRLADGNIRVIHAADVFIV
jgi:BirA family biotin operon repressor/biotin-[acetyl-CoA-carboxylase] ligase